MSINKIVILGDEGAAAKLKALFSKASIGVFLSDLKGDYAKELKEGQGGRPGQENGAGFLQILIELI